MRHDQHRAAVGRSGRRRSATAAGRGRAARRRSARPPPGSRRRAGSRRRRVGRPGDRCRTRPLGDPGGKSAGGAETPLQLGHRGDPLLDPGPDRLDVGRAGSEPHDLAGAPGDRLAFERRGSPGQLAAAGSRGASTPRSCHPGQAPVDTCIVQHMQRSAPRARFSVWLGTSIAVAASFLLIPAAVPGGDREAERVADINPGPLGSSPVSPVALGRQIVFPRRGQRVRGRAGRPDAELAAGTEVIDTLPDPSVRSRAA